MDCCRLRRLTMSEPLPVPEDDEDDRLYCGLLTEDD